MPQASRTRTFRCGPQNCSPSSPAALWLGKDRGHLLDEDLALCQKAVTERNRHAHRFFREPWDKMSTDAGCDEMTQDALQ